MNQRCCERKKDKSSDVKMQGEVGKGQKMRRRKMMSTGVTKGEMWRRKESIDGAEKEENIS